MKVLGPYLMGYLDQRQLIAGGSIDLPRDHRLRRHLIRARIGDLLWVKEPFMLYTSYFRKGPQNIHCVVPGPIGTRPPEHVRKLIEVIKGKPVSALKLERPDSRCTLEIMTIGEHSVRCLVHMQQVDVFLKARAAA